MPEVRDEVDFVLRGIAQVLRHNKSLTITSFGRFDVVDVPPMQKRLPDGRVIFVEAKKRVRFKPAAQLNEAMMPMFSACSTTDTNGQQATPS